ncbi:MAG: Ferric reductase domain protein transmembrane component domain protein [Candidatus Moranbacteria bacterium GW2011_GWE1_35_17]|nr:MAG: Ferric reductase domain protein transmembrane component domain protein [Candidatus Moranbacteria bacterium GW2011_GWE1_35_17]
MKNKIIISSLFIAGLFLGINCASAQDNAETRLDYKEELILDSDLDGLTDLGEKEIFKTDPLNPDSDSDGFYDGAEILGKTNPLDNLSPVVTRTISESTTVLENEAPWAWYVARVTGLISFSLLYIVMFLGLSIRTPILNKLVKPIHSLNIHAWLSVQALVLVFVHGGALLFDKYLKFTWPDILVPFFNKTYSPELALGIMAMYLMLILIGTSYLKKFIKHGIWRVVHFLNIALYTMAVYHALYLGTDLASEMARNIFIGANIFLVVIVVINIFTRIIKFIQRKRQQI